MTMKRSVVFIIEIKGIPLEECLYVFDESNTSVIDGKQVFLTSELSLEGYDLSSHVIGQFNVTLDQRLNSVFSFTQPGKKTAVTDLLFNDIVQTTVHTEV